MITEPPSILLKTIECPVCHEKAFQILKCVEDGGIIGDCYACGNLQILNKILYETFIFR